MKTKVSLTYSEYIQLLTLEIGEILETQDDNGRDIYIERVESYWLSAVKINNKYFVVNYFAPSIVEINADGRTFRTE